MSPVVSGDKLSESVGESRGIGGVRPREGKRELFAPVATHEIDLADVVLDETRDLSEDRIARRV
ncbi:MAG: hypothetical protein VX427_18105 [Acidobacteriota bacterium]|nr:hypothetical protein [Acidobacteriota bacterium]